MSAFQEKILYGLFMLAGAGASTMGAALTSSEARWLYVTITASIITAGNLALVFKRSDEGMRIVIGRSGLAFLAGVLGSRFAVLHWKLDFVDGDVVLLAGFAAGVTIVGFIIGYPFLQLVNSKSGGIVKKLFDKWLP